MSLHPFFRTNLHTFQGVFAAILERVARACHVEESLGLLRCQGRLLRRTNNAVRPSNGLNTVGQTERRDRTYADRWGGPSEDAADAMTGQNRTPATATAKNTPLQLDYNGDPLSHSKGGSETNI